MFHIIGRKRVIFSSDPCPAAGRSDLQIQLAERLGSMLNLSLKHPSREWPCEHSRALSTTTVEKFRAKKFVDCRVGFEAVWASGARLPVAGPVTDIESSILKLAR
jgi:hypothetical protein